MSERQRLISEGKIRPAVNGKAVKRWGWDKRALWDAGYTIAATRRIPECDKANIGYVH